ncbi:MAG: GyrI-like domain-containing protein [Planctomycetota bacterium]
MQPPQIEVKPELLIAGCEAPFIHALSPDANNGEVIPQVWDRLMNHLRTFPHQSCEPMYGLIEQRQERSHPHELWYVAGVPVSSPTSVPDGMVLKQVSAGMFAVFTHRGPMSGIGETVGYAYREWLPHSGMELADGPDVELYDGRFDFESETSEMEYWIPVARSAAR